MNVDYCYIFCISLSSTAQYCLTKVYKHVKVWTDKWLPSLIFFYDFFFRKNHHRISSGCYWGSNKILEFWFSGTVIACAKHLAFHSLFGVHYRQDFSIVFISAFWIMCEIVCIVYFFLSLNGSTPYHCTAFGWHMRSRLTLLGQQLMRLVSKFSDISISLRPFHIWKGRGSNTWQYRNVNGTFKKKIIYVFTTFCPSHFKNIEFTISLLFLSTLVDFLLNNVILHTC